MEHWYSPTRTLSITSETYTTIMLKAYRYRTVLTKVYVELNDWECSKELLLWQKWKHCYRNHIFIAWTGKRRSIRKAEKRPKHTRKGIKVATSHKLSIASPQITEQQDKAHGPPLEKSTIVTFHVRIAASDVYKGTKQWFGADCCADLYRACSCWFACTEICA